MIVSFITPLGKGRCSFTKKLGNITTGCEKVKDFAAKFCSKKR
jgi:hypothetical protein